MRSLWLLLAGVLLCGLGACRARPQVDTAPFELAFEMVTDTNRVAVDAALAEVRAGRLEAAALAFRRLQREYRLNPRQELAVEDLLRQLAHWEPGGSGAGTNAPAGGR